MIKFNDEKGSITTIVTVTILFMITILTTMYLTTVSLRKAQLKSQERLKNVYSQTTNGALSQGCITYNNDAMYLDSNQEVVKIPKGFCVVNDLETKKNTVQNGLVISDVENDDLNNSKHGNQYVWIPINKNAIFNGIEIQKGNVNYYQTVENALWNYVLDGQEDKVNSDKYIAETVDSNLWYSAQSEFTAEKNIMLESIVEKGGFFIGRFEAGVVNARSQNSNLKTVPLSQKNLIPYNYVSRAKARNLAQSVNIKSEDYTSNLMFDIQWELVLKFIEANGNVASSVLYNNSTIIGNYIGNTVLVTNPNAKYLDIRSTSGIQDVPADGIRNSDYYVFSTGSTDDFSQCNIFDFAGNMSEWTLGKSTNNTASRRGGAFNSTNKNAVLIESSNGDCMETSFRVSIY